MKLSRRSFLFGSAATLATIAVAEIAPYIEPVVLQSPGYKERRIFAMAAAGHYLANAENQICVRMKRWPLHRYPLSLFEVRIHPRTSFVWNAQPGQEFVFLENAPMLLETTGSPSEVMIEGKDDGVWFAEFYQFPQGTKQKYPLVT